MEVKSCVSKDLNLSRQTNLSPGTVYKIVVVVVSNVLLSCKGLALKTVNCIAKWNLPSFC